MKIWKTVTLATVLIGISASILAAFTTSFALATPTAVFAVAAPVAAALVLVLYFNWRAKLKSQILGNDSRDDDLARAA